MPSTRGARASSRAQGHTAEQATQQPEEIARVIEEFLALHPEAVVLEDGRVAFEMRSAKYTLSTLHGRCSFQLWSEEANLVRRVVAFRQREEILRLSVLRLGQSKPTSLEIAARRDRRTVTDREAVRVRFLKLLERALLRQLPDWAMEGLSSAMDLERSFGPAYARGRMVQGQRGWAVVAVNQEETQATIDGILTVGLLWLERCREMGDGRRVWQGLRLIVPRGTSALVASRMVWLNKAAAQWELYELDAATEELVQRDLADHGNISTRVLRAVNQSTVRERFAAATAAVLRLVPERQRGNVELLARSNAELALLLHGLEFARVRVGFGGASFNAQEQITVGAGANETPLTAETEAELREFVAQLFERRQAGADKRDPLYRMQPERWLESMLRLQVDALDPHLRQAQIYSQVPAFAAGDRGMLDLLGVLEDGRLAVIELKADEDMHLALQGLDYWVRVRWHHQQVGGDPSRAWMDEFQRNGYFEGAVLSPAAPKLYLVAPALRVHPATEAVLRYLAPEVEWELVALDERWRQKLKVVWRRRSTDRR